MPRPLKPALVEHKINSMAWWYEEKDGILVVQEARTPSGVHLAVVRAKIPWISLIAAAKRLGKIKSG